jgi:glycosyltransferase involved in cell wall biosynthesis
MFPFKAPEHLAPKDLAHGHSAEDQLAISILMGTYNGQDYFAEQLHSIANQTHRNWQLHISDDGSKDEFFKTLEALQSKWGSERITLRHGPKQGFAANFLSLVADPSIDTPLYAFCDQDDVWFPEKLARAAVWHASQNSLNPALYASAATLTDAAGTPLRLMAAPTRSTAFGNALVENIAAGHTMVFNAAARQLLARAAAAGPVLAHDWLTYGVVTAAGGVVYVDPQPSVFYRQHGNNVIGVNTSFQFLLYRARRIIGTAYQDAVSAHVRALGAIEDSMTPTNRERFNTFLQARSAPMVQRLAGVRRSRVYRQTRLGDVSLTLATMLGRI